MSKRRAFDPARHQHRPPSETAFLAALASQQNGCPDPQFAHRLGVSLSLWRHTRDGRLPLGLKLWTAGKRVVGYDVADAAHKSLLARIEGRLSPSRA